MTSLEAVSRDQVVKSITQRYSVKRPSLTLFVNNIKIFNLLSMYMYVLHVCSA